MTPDRPKSPLDIFCRGCAAPPGQKCGVMPNRSLLRRRLRAGDPVETYWIRVLSYFHDMRWRDFNKVSNEWAALDDWEKRYGGKTA
jgi:hypothetical protein